MWRCQTLNLSPVMQCADKRRYRPLALWGTNTCMTEILLPLVMVMVMVMVMVNEEMPSRLTLEFPFYLCFICCSICVLLYS